MKKLLALLSISLIFLTSCHDDDRPVQDIIDEDTIGQTVEIDNVDFVAPDFAVNIPFNANNLDVFNSDVILVYRLEDVVNGQDVWEPLPTTNIFLDNGGELLYRYNFTESDVDILMESPDFGLIGNEFTQDQVFRIVVVPSAFALAKVNLKNYNEVISALNLQHKKITKITLN